MHADYVPNPLYDNNPFIEALPPMLSGKDLIRALAVIPPYSDSDRDRSTGERLQLLSSLYEFYQPLSMTIDLYCEIYTAMQHCYFLQFFSSAQYMYYHCFALHTPKNLTPRILCLPARKEFQKINDTL